MVANSATKNHSSFELAAPPHGSSKCFDDDGRLKRTGTVWTASAHIITAVIGSGVLSLAWATAQLGWIAGPTVLFLFSFVTYYTSCLLAACYRSGDPVNGKRNYTYMEAVQANLGGFKVKICGAIQYLNLFGVAIGYTIAASISMMAIKRSNCFHGSHAKNPCRISSNPYMIAFGAMEILFSQIPDFDQISWLSIVAAIMSFTYSSIGLALGVAKVAETGKFRGSLTGISIGTVTQTQKIWRSFQALGAIAFAYSYSLILIEIQDTVKSPPSESKTIKRATLISVTVTTVFYMLCGCFGYAAFGDLAPGNLLTGFGFYNPFWLLDIANAAIVIHLVGAYQVYCQPLFAFVEKNAAKFFPESDFINKEYDIPLPGGFKPYKLNLFRLVWRTIFVILTTIISMLMPFFNDVVGILGAFGFWPLTVYFPVEMYIVQQKIPKWSTRWISLQILSAACLIISIAAAAGSFAGVVTDLKVYIVFPVLKTLSLAYIDNLWCTRSMGSNTDQHQPSILQKVSFPRLEVLWVRGISSEASDLVELMGVNANLPRDHGIHHLLCFRGLKMLTVEDCKLSTIFTCSMAKTNLQQLEELTVGSCEKMEEIVRDENEGNMNLMADAADEILSCEFPRLKRIEMGDLPVLKSFCGSGRYTFNMPSLERVLLRNCPLLRNFTCRQLTTPPKFTISDDDWSWKECTDLDKYLQTLLVDRPEGGDIVGKNSGLGHIP